MPPKKETDDGSALLAVAGIAFLTCLCFGSFFYALTWPIRLGAVAIWCILFSNTIYPDPKDNLKNSALKALLLALLVGGSVMPNALPDLVYKTILMLSILPQAHMLVMLREASADYQEKNKNKKECIKTNEFFAKGVVFYTGFTLLSIGVTVFNILS